jgi:iron complex transport system substrate-binding protein
MRIRSLLPSATEIAYAIGLGDSIFGVSHECDFPADAATRPSLLRTRVDPQAPPAEIDRQVSDIIARARPDPDVFPAGMLAGTFRRL